MSQQYKSTIAYKIFIFTLIVSIIPMSIISGIFCSKIENKVKLEMSSLYKNTIDQYISNMEYKIDLYGYTIEDTATDAITQDVLSLINRVPDRKLFVLDDGMNWVYGTEKKKYWFKYKQDIIEALETDQGELVLEDSKYLIFSGTISDYGWTIITLMGYSEINEAIHKFISPTFYINILFYIILFTACLIFSSSMTRRLKILTKKMEKVESGVMETEPVITGNDEIAIIDKNFNDMVMKLTKLIEENYIQTIKKREAQIMALQFQINPHFLYNTLELINSMASYYNCDDIAVVSQKLGQMFRYNMDDNASKYATVGEEIEHIQNYYIIQKIRFEGKIKLQINVADEFLQYQTPRFLLQPLVENAFIHGFGREKTEGIIEISCHQVDDDMYIVIEDDGEGIGEERLLCIRQHIDEYARTYEFNDRDRLLNKSNMGLGLYNVHSRIKLYYGDDYGLTIESTENVGTKITVHIPKRE